MDETHSRSTAELIRETLSDLVELVRKEMELARIELTEGLLEKVKGIGLLALALALVLPGIVFVLVAVALFLPLGPAWGFLIVGGAMFAMAATAVAVGVMLLKRKRGPKVVVDSIKEDVRWARGRLTR